MAEEQPEEAQNSEAAAEQPVEAPAPDAPGGGTDALLSMFAHDESEAQDLTLIVSMSPDVEIDDLLEELNTVAVALGIKLRHEDIALAA